MKETLPLEIGLDVVTGSIFACLFIAAIGIAAMADEENKEQKLKKKEKQLKEKEEELKKIEKQLKQFS